MLLPLLWKPLQPLTGPSTLRGHTYLTGMVGRAVALALDGEAGGVGWKLCFPSAWVFCPFHSPHFTITV